MRPSSFLLSLLLIAPLLSAPAQAQGPALPSDLFHFDFFGDGIPVVVPTFPGVGSATLTFQDTSRDEPQGLAPGAPSTQLFPHYVTFTPSESTDPGWIVAGVASLVSYPGDGPREVRVDVTVTGQAKVAYLKVTVTAVMTSANGPPINRSADVVFVASGFKSIQTQSAGGQLHLAPREVGDAAFLVENIGLYPRSVSFRVSSNPCAMGIGAPSTVALEPGQRQEIHFSVQAPANGLYYQSDNCSLTVEAVPADITVQGGKTLTSPSVSAPVFAYVSGFYVAPEWIFWWLLLALVIFALVLFIRRRKAMIEERILGKPQKPWLIPVERVYLRELRKKDPRAWYVVRHYLMEEEYRSALAWFSSYKQATKGSRKKEALILKQEAAYEAWKAKWAKAIAKPVKKADKRERRLQAKLDRKAKRATRKDARKWRKKVRKLEAKAAKKAKAAAEKHAKVAAKARKKGLPAPVPPLAATPDLPPKPEPRRYVLAEHRWAKKAARYRRRRVREQGNLEVKFERQDAKYLAKLRRKVRRIARKLDDPDFVGEHPLLRETA